MNNEGKNKSVAIIILFNVYIYIIFLFLSILFNLFLMMMIMSYLWTVCVFAPHVLRDPVSVSPFIMSFGSSVSSC